MLSCTPTLDHSCWRYAAVSCSCWNSWRTAIVKTSCVPTGTVTSCPFVFVKVMSRAAIRMPLPGVPPVQLE